MAASMNELADEIRDINRANGWLIPEPVDWAETPYKIPAMLALIHSEVSEALEAFREDDCFGFEEELADILIRLLDLSRGLGIDIDGAVRRKMEINRERSERHGGKRL